MARQWRTADERRAAAVAAANDRIAKQHGMAGWLDRRDHHRRERLGQWRTARPTSAARDVVRVTNSVRDVGPTVVANLAGDGRVQHQLELGEAS